MTMPAGPSLPDAVGECRLLPVDGQTEHWSTALAGAPVQPVGYHRTHCDYQHTYFSAAFADYRPLDRLILRQDQPVALWPLALYRQEECWGVSSHLNGTPGIAPPLPLADLTDKAARSVNLAWLGAIAELTANLPDTTVLRFITPTAGIEIPDWHSRLLRLGARPRARYRMLVDLGIPDDDYHRGLRKSYKALINQARRLWQADVDDRGDVAAFAAFQTLHERVAGRKTRPQATWDRQFEAIRQGAAFAVYLREPDGRLIGASLYNASRDEAYYAVGAYDRELFDRPVAHLSLDAAIRHARASGRRQFILGDQPFPGDTPPPSDKEAKIAFFKEGFSTAVQLLPTLELTAAQLAPLRPGGAAA